MSFYLFFTVLLCSAVSFVTPIEIFFQSGAKSLIFNISKKDCLKDRLENCVRDPHPTDFAMTPRTVKYTVKY
jgi:hypothetical protein